MSDKDSKPWESTFGEDESDSEESKKLSRVTQKKKRHSNTLLVWILALVLLAVMFIPIIVPAISSSHDKSAIDSANQVSVSSKAKKSVTKPKSKPKPKTHKVQKARKVTSKLDENNSNKDKPANNPPANNDQVNNSQNQNQNGDNHTNSQTANNGDTAAQNASQNQNQNTDQYTDQYYIVQARDNAYRIALNHGMTTAQLYQLNGMSPGTVLHPGMQLRIK